MAGNPAGEASALSKGAWFATTHWSVVLMAGHDSSPDAQAALEKLCQIYWYPLYAFIRREGYQIPDAQDLTQAFFAHLLERRFPRGVVEGKGKFRSVLLTALRHFLADQRDHRLAQKRGAGQTPVFLDAQQAEASYQFEPVDRMDAEKIYQRRWAITLMNRVLDRLKDELQQTGKAGVYEQLKDFLIGENTGLTYREAGVQLAMTEGAVKVAVHRMRQRYRELFREEVAHTVADPSLIDDEVRQIFAAISL